MPHERRIFFENLIPHLNRPDLSGRQEDLGLINIDPSSEHYHYLSNVLRLKARSKLTVVCKTSRQEYTAEVLEAVSSGLTIQLLNRIEAAEPEQPLRVSTLLFAICKGDTNDLVCEKATELGIDNIILWKADRSIPVLSNVENKLKRWQKIIESSASQSGRKSLPGLLIAESLAAAIKLPPLQGIDSSKFYCSLETTAVHVGKLDRNIIREAAVVIGPEGDFSELELSRLKAENFLPVSLGNSRLRSETAAIAGIAMLQV